MTPAHQGVSSGMMPPLQLDSAYYSMPYNAPNEITRFSSRSRPLPVLPRGQDLPPSHEMVTSSRPRCTEPMTMGSPRQSRVPLFGPTPAAMTAIRTARSTIHPYGPTLTRMGGHSRDHSVDEINNMMKDTNPPPNAAAPPAENDTDYQQKIVRLRFNDLQGSGSNEKINQEPTTLLPLRKDT